MSEKNDKKPLPETQHERWLKYGVNVSITIFVVLALAFVAIWQSQKRRVRIDSTASAVNSLKPQTHNILKDLKTKVTLVSFYSRSPNKKEGDTTDYAGQVEDLLDEYRRLSPNIEVELIDPDVEFSKRDDLIKRVTEKYGGEVQKYREYVDAYPPKYEALLKASTEQRAAFDKLPLDEVRNRQLVRALQTVYLTLRQFVEPLDNTKKATDKLLAEKIPDYKQVTDIVRSEMAQLAIFLDATIAAFEDNLKNPELPASFKEYFTTNLPKLQEMKKTAEGLIADGEKLGELKLDALKRSLESKEGNDSIIVMGETDLRVIPRDKVWLKSVDRNGTGQIVKPLFAGEQQISTAIFALTNPKKTKVAIMRAGGPPLADGNPFFRPEMPIGEVVSRLRAYNFEVLEKDYTGQFAMQMQMQGMPAMPEPTDEELKDAIWIVFNSRPQQNRMGMPPPPSISAKLKEHLDNGGSALVLSSPESDDLNVPLEAWGVKTDPLKIALHERTRIAGARKGTQLEEIQKNLQYAFFINRYGEHELTSPLRTLDGVLAPIIPVTYTGKEGFTGASILPLPNDPPTWATAVSELRSRREEVKYDEKRGDTRSPIFGGAAVEKKDGGRLVVIGCQEFAADQLVRMPDPDAEDEDTIPRFPANGELFTNSVFWLAKLDSMIAISPAGPQISRIEPMSDRASRVWSVGVLLIGLPGLVVVAGVSMYLARRD